MAKKTDKTEVSKNTKNTKTVKKAKTEKLVKAKKLPGFFKKKFTKDAFAKKVLKKIYIDADKKYIQEKFELSTDKKGREILVFNRNAMILKDDFIRCKKIAVDVKKQKGAIKLVPLLAVVVLLCAIGISVTLFKNTVLSYGIRSAMQGIFGAKTDIQKVDLKIFSASLEIDGLQQANADSPMKNLFEIDKIDVSFNLTDLLRGKFHAKNIEVSGVALDTEREKSGELLHVKKSAEEKAVQKETLKSSESIKNDVAQSLEKMFENYDPEKMLSGIQNELTSPQVATSIAEDVKAKVTKWQSVPSEYQKSVTSLTNSVNSLSKTNWGNITNASTLKKALSDIENAMTEANSLKKKVSVTATEIKTDSTAVSGYSKKLQDAVKQDTKLVDSKIAEMKSLFSSDGIKNILTEAVRSVLLEKTGKFYPYAEKAMNAALSAKGNATSSEKSTDSSLQEKKTKKAKTSHTRSSGRTVYYKKDTVPKLMIENIVASGYEYKSNELLFKGTAQDVSSNQDMCGKPALINADFKVTGKPNKVKVTVDARSSSNVPLISADYSGKGYPVNADAKVFSFNSLGNINALLTCDNNGSFTVGGTLDLSISEMKGMEFSPEKVSELYGKAMSGIKNLTVGFNVLYSKENGMSVELTNVEKLAKQLSQSVTAALSLELNSIASDAKNNVTKMISEKTGIATEQISAFTDISNTLNGQIKSVNNLQKQLEEQKSKINKQLTGAAKSAVKSAAADALKKLF